ncbi:SpoIIE family protein phosphatase [Streptomyces sp. NPDC005132]|uniref:ATP-binding SpoIIE family protein phosphatase n=1 Tax=Streptomyces sp. NPDC005132 TaxID=3154294 RepID=UPI0033B65036
MPLPARFPVASPYGSRPEEDDVMHRTPLVPRRTGTAAPSLRAAFITLLIAVVVVAGARLVLAAAGMQVMGMAEYSTLIPVVAAALLPLRQTLIVGLANLVVAILAYGILLPSMSHASRITVITALVASILVSLAVCRARIAAERSLKGLMVARERLTLLSEASTRVGGTLDVARTAEELAEVAVRRFADQAAVDLFDPVLKGEEPARGPHAGPVTLRRAARRSVPAALAAAAPPDSSTVTYRRGSMPALSLLRGVPMHGQFTDAADGEECWPADPNGTGTQAPHSTLAVPLRARGVTLGAALFTRSRHRDPFDADDVLLAQEIAARAAVCVDNARRYTHERATSVALQRSLLPQAVPPQPAVQAVARYLPADIEAGVGGDWYDVIPLSGARVALVVGDVVGHGIRASAAMGRLRTAVRTLADIDLPPDELLTHLDDIVIRLQSETAPTPAGSGEDAVADADVGEFVATCLYMVYDPISRRCTAARAGHPPPAVVRPGEGARFLDLPAGPPLGVGGLPFETAEIQLPEGSLLALYTDGLVESPRHGLDERLERLLEVLSESKPTLQEACDHVLDLLVDDRTRDDRTRDDIALVVARTRALDDGHTIAWELLEDLSEVARARDLASLQVARWGLPEAAFLAELVVSELVTNAIRYGGSPVQLRLIRHDTLICEVSDGSNTAPHLRRARTFDEGGRGLFIVAQLAERWGTRQQSDGKTIWAELALPPATGPRAQGDAQSSSNGDVSRPTTAKQRGDLHGHRGGPAGRAPVGATPSANR